MTRTKLCGLTREQDLDAAIEAGTDMVGFVSSVPIETPRELAPARAAELTERVPESVTSVLVTMPDMPEEGAELAERVGPDAIQIHGCSPSEIGVLAEHIAVPVIAAVDATDGNLEKYAAVADALVLDSTDEQGAGGTGETHDWARARNIVADLDIPVLLAGGLTPENVAGAVKAVEPFGVDVSSGVETKAGTKDHTKLRRFVERARGEPERMSDTGLSLNRERFVELASDRSRPAVVRTVAPLDMDVEPLAAYATLADGTDYTFLLESAEKVASSDPDGAFAPSEEGGHARYSFMGYDPAAVVTIGPDETDVETFGGRYANAIDTCAGDTLDRLRGALPDADLVNFPATDRQQLDGGLVGYLAYDSVYDLHLDEVGLTRPDSPVPDAQFVLSTKTVAFDHAAGTVSLVFTPLVGPDDDPHAVYDELEAELARVRGTLSDAAVDVGGFERKEATAGSREEYEESVRRAKEHVLDGDSYQVVLSRARELVGEIDPRGLYAALRDINPSPYMYLLEYGDRSVVGASPETLVSVRGDEVVSNPLAGTCSRGTSPVEDRRLAGELLADEKERAEHTMLVDLARNDVRRVSRPGSVRVDEFMTVLKYSHVQHIESTVTGRLADERDAFDAVRAAFPMGTLSGAPKVRAMEIIDALETTPRGLYGGGVGYFSWDGDADVAITIRTALVEQMESDEDRITVRAGAGIVADSEPESEYNETERKMDGVLAALDRIEQPSIPEPRQ